MSVDAPYAFGRLPVGAGALAGAPPILPDVGHHLMAGGDCAMARNLSLKAERDARALVRRVATLAERASLQELRAEIARIGLALSNAEMARRLSGA